MTAPHVDRPGIPNEYGISDAAAGMLEWGSVAAALRDAEIYWVATSRPDGGPHLVPVHATAIEGVVFASGSESSSWSRNLRGDGRLHVGVDHAGLQVMARGVGRLELPDAAQFATVDEQIQSKYGWSFGEPLPMWILEPTTVLAFDPVEFATSPTRFTFDRSG